MLNRSVIEDGEVKRHRGTNLFKYPQKRIAAVQTLKTLVSPERRNTNSEAEITAINTETVT